MNSLTEDLWRIILARLPLKIITTSMLVCKRWKSIVESPYFRKLFLSHHQNSDSSWSLFFNNSPDQEVVSHYGCEIWGLERSLGSYVSSFLETQKERVEILAYTDVGLILFGLLSDHNNRTYFVANPISRECVKLPPRSDGKVHLKFSYSLWRFVEVYSPGLVTRVLNDLLLGYKVVVLTETSKIAKGVLCLLVYSSETGLWSSKTLQQLPHGIILSSLINPISLNGAMYWIGYNGGTEFLVSHDFYSESDRCQVLQFPDNMESLDLTRSFTVSQECIMYANLIYESGKGVVKLCVWRLKGGEWESVSNIPTWTILFDYYPLAINPFHGNTMYMWSRLSRNFATINLEEEQLELYNNYKHKDCRTLSFAREWNPDLNNIGIPFLPMFVLPRWLHRIPSSSSS